MIFRNHSSSGRPQNCPIKICWQKFFATLVTLLHTVANFHDKTIADVENRKKNDDVDIEKRNLIDYHATLLNLAKREYVLLVAIQDMYL